MSSWVRYAVAVYIGLLISGALARPPVQVPAAETAPAPSVHYEVPEAGSPLPTMPDTAPVASTDVSV